MTTKETNPKDAIGSKKAPMSCVPACVLAEIGVGMLDGAVKYGKFNYRDAGVRSSVYYDATLRHLFAWHEGEDCDPDSGLSHITKAITSLVVLRDAMIQGKVTDDRPPKSAAFYPALNDRAAEIVEKYSGDKAVADSDGWVERPGGECPVADKARVEYRMRDGCAYKDKAGLLRWHHNDKLETDIIAYRVVEQAMPEYDSDGWVVWNGGECPVADKKLVDVRLADGSELGHDFAKDLRWDKRDRGSDIIAYRVVK